MLTYLAKTDAAAEDIEDAEDAEDTEDPADAARADIEQLKLPEAESR